jgi:hypothetical protein
VSHPIENYFSYKLGVVILWPSFVTTRHPPTNMMLRPSSTLLLALLGAVASTLGCVIPDEPLSNNIPERFSIFVQNASIPIVHNRVMNFRPNGEDKHLVLRPSGDPTFDLMYLENGLLRYAGLHAVIDLEVRFSWSASKRWDEQC